MQTSVQTIDSVRRKITVTIPNQKIKDAVDEKISSMKKSVKISGFRQGKVPVPVIKQQYGKAVRADVIDKLIQSSYIETINSGKLNPVAPPKINSEEKSFLSGDFVYHATFEVYPEIGATDLSKLKVDLPDTKITEADTDYTIEELQKQHKTFVKTDKKSETGDQVTIDFTGFIDGVEFDGGKAEKIPVILGSKSMIEGFEDGLINLKAEDETTLDLTFPANYQAVHLANKKAQFKIKVTEVAKSQLPKLDKEFLDNFKIKDGNIAEFRAQIKQGLDYDCESAKRQFIKTQVLDNLAEIHKALVVPESMIDKEIQQMVNGLKQQMQGAGDLDKLFEDTEPMKPEATRRVIVGLAMSEIIKTNNIKLDQEKLKQLVEDESQSYPEPQKFIDHYFQDEKHLKSIKPVVFEQQVIDYIVEVGKTNDVKLSFADLKNKSKNNQN